MADTKQDNRQFPNLTVVSNPLILHKMSLLRDISTGKNLFAELIAEITQLLMFEAAKDLPTSPREVRTPLETTNGQEINGRNITIIPILRAGLGMMEGALQVLPTMRVGFLGLERDHITLEPSTYYSKVPLSDPDSRHVLVLDPMLATAGTAEAAIEMLYEAGAKNICILCIVAAPEGVQRLLEKYPTMPIYAAALDRELSDKGYILPGLGDAGDRLFGTQ